MITDSIILSNKTNSYLKTFNNHRFKSEDLKNAVPLRSQNQQQQQITEDYTRYTNNENNNNNNNNMTSMTGVSDSGLVMDPEDKDRAVEDLVAFKHYVSTLKFAYTESNIKLQFVSHIMDKNGPKHVSQNDTAALEVERLRTKAELKSRKVRATELESLIRAEAELLDQNYTVRQEEATLAAQILEDCERMEVEIAMLKNKRSPDERITIEEAQSICDSQEAKMATYGPDIKACEVKIKETRLRIRGHKGTIEKLGLVARDMKREQEDREAKGKRDERAEEGCRWITNATALYSSLLGIRSAEAIGSPTTEMRIVYESPQGTEGDLRTLSISIGSNGSMTGAKLLDSSDDIEDLVQLYLLNQDVRSLVQEVRARIGR